MLFRSVRHDDNGNPPIVLPDAPRKGQIGKGRGKALENDELEFSLTGETGKETGKFGVTIQMHDFWQGGEGIELIARFIEICSYGIEQGNGKHNRLPFCKEDT